MEKNRENCYEIAKQIYQLDKEVYECVGSSLGRTFTGDEATCVEEITRLLITRPQGHEIRSDIALIGNMARTIKNKEDHHRMMTQYNEILKKIAAIPDSFGSVDIINENLAALNTSNLRQKFSPDDHLIICIGRTHGSAGTDIGFALADKLKINYYDAEIFDQVLKKMDAETKEAISGAEFTVYRWKNNTWSEFKKMNWVKKTGSYLLEGILDTDSENGKFRVVETKNPAGYAGSWEQEFSIDKEGMQTIHLEAENTRKTGSLKIKKTEENSGKALSGATYQVIASGAITTVNGTVLFPDQAVAAVLKTDENGEAFKDGLEYGTYLVRETAAPNGYVLDPTEKKITIGEQNAQITLTFTNWKNRFILQKVSQGDGKVLQGAAFHIWTKDGSFDETKKTDANGKIELTGLLDGVWYYQETASPEGYLLDSTCREFVVENGKIDGKSELSVTVENDGTHLTIEKIDAESGKRISGAKLVLKDMDGNRVDSWISGGSGPHELEKLKPGSYVIVEEAAPDGYLAAEPVSFVLEAKQEVQTVTMKDLACETLTITKKIKADEITWAHGNPTFLFSVKGKDLYGKEHTYQCYLTFTKTQVEKTTDQDGYTEQSVQIRGIPAGNDYRVQEKKVLRYSLMQVTGTKNVTVKKLEEPAYGKDPARVFSVSVNLCGHPKESEVVFENQKYRWDDYGHNSIVKNRIPVE